MQNNAKISIVTINYNNPSGLKKTIESVVNQTWKNFEYIIIDGGSTNGDVDIIKSFENQIDYWVSEPDKGIYNAMNKGIKKATGDFIIFMNSGDNFNDNNVLENTVPLFNKDAYFIYGNNYKEKENSKRLKTDSSKLTFSFFYTSSLNHQATFIKRDVFTELFYYDENKKIVSDWELFVVGICKQNLLYQYINQTISVYDFTGMSSNKKYQDITDQEKLDTLEKYFPAFVDDYKNLSLLNSKRFQHVLHIQKSPFIWNIFKKIISFFLLFTPKIKK